MTMSFHSLHEGPAPLILPNAWDIGSALALLEAGFPAVGSTSLGVAASRGLSDATRSTGKATLHLARELSRLPCFVSIDIEDGFSDDPEEVAAYVQELGVAGINIEDATAGALIDQGLAAAKIAAIRANCPGLFINARVDTVWLGPGIDLNETLNRVLAYAAAGADGIFVPGPLDAQTIMALVGNLELPLNVLPSALYTAAELGAMGVRRISTGSLPYRAAMDATVRAAVAVRDSQPLPAASSYEAVVDRVARLGGPHP